MRYQFATSKRIEDGGTTRQESRNETDQVGPRRGRSAVDHRVRFVDYYSLG